MSSAHIASKAFLLAIFTTSLTAMTARAVVLPSDEDVTGVLKLCAVGRVQRIQGDVEGKIQLWKKQADAKGSASIDDLGAILGTVDHGQQISPEVYKVYTDCIKEMVSQFMKTHASNEGQTTINAPGGVGAKSIERSPITINNSQPPASAPKQ